jgi:hypothetical protein
MADEIPHDVVFSLVCENCDAGMEIGSHEEALDAGWTYLRYAPELPMANFVGLCQDCRRIEEELDAHPQED